MSQEEQKFDLAKFNKDFENNKNKSKEEEHNRLKEKLNELNKEDDRKKIYELNIFEILVGIKDAWFDLIDDILAHNITLRSFTRNNRLFFFGITIIFIGCVLYLYSMLFREDNSSDMNSEHNITKIYHYYQAPIQPTTQLYQPQEIRVRTAQPEEMYYPQMYMDPEENYV
jgi:hypothetical protein